MNRFASFIYEKLFRRTSTFVLVVGAGAIFTDRAVDVVADNLFCKINEGRLWKDVKRQLNLEAPK